MLQRYIFTPSYSNISLIFNQIYPFSAPPFFIVNFLPLSFRISIKVIIFASVLQNQKRFYEDHRG